MALLLILYLLITTLIAPQPVASVSAAPTNTQHKIDYTSINCPSDPLTTLPTPTYGDTDAIFTICTSLLLATDPLTAYNAVLDFQSYARWNSFVVDVLLPDNITTPKDVYVGMAMEFTSVGLIGEDLNSTSDEIISFLDSSYDDESDGNRYLVNAWRYDDGAGGWGARAEHPNVFVDLGNGTTRYLSWETYYAGWTTGTIALLKEQLQKQWGVQGLDLKKYVEGS